MIVFKINVLEELKNKGYNTTKIRNETRLNETALQQIRRGKVPGLTSISHLCELLKMQPGQLLKYVPDSQNIPGGQDQEQNK